MPELINTLPANLLPVVAVGVAVVVVWAVGIVRIATKR